MLPNLIGPGEGQDVLAAAIKAFGVSIMARGHNGRAPFIDALEAQYSAIRSLQKATRVGATSFNTIAAAIMCLLLSQVVVYSLHDVPYLPFSGQMLIPTSAASSVIHTQGLRDLIQCRSPAFYAVGVPHQLFAGFRPVLVCCISLDTSICHLYRSSFYMPFNLANLPFSPSGIGRCIHSVREPNHPFRPFLMRLLRCHQFS